MLPLQTLPLLQTGLKYLFDIDPTLTEHFFRNTVTQIELLSGNAGIIIRSFGIKCADMIAPVMHDLRDFRLSGHEV